MIGRQREFINSVLLGKNENEKLRKIVWTRGEKDINKWTNPLFEFWTISMHIVYK